MRIGEIVGPGFVYQTESTILRVTLRTVAVEDAFLLARRRARTWLEDLCKRRGLDVLLDGDVEKSNDRCAIDLLQRSQRLAASVRHGDDRFPERTWHLDLDLRAAEEDVAVCDLRLRAEHPSNARPIDPHPVRLIGLLCADPGLHDVERLRLTASVLRASDVPSVAALIDAEKRRLPVILASRPLALDLEAVATELTGLAHVYELDEEASWEISNRYDKRRSAYLGAVKIYPPAVTMQSDPKASRLILAQTLQMLSREHKAESTVRRGILADLTAEFEAEPLITPALLRAQEMQVRRLTPESEAPRSSVTEHPAAAVPGAPDQEAQRARQEAAAARQEAEGYWHEILELNARIEKLEEEIAQLRESELGISVEELSPGARELLRTVFGAVTRVRDLLLENDQFREELLRLGDEYESLRAKFARFYAHDGSAQTPAVEEEPRPAWNDFDALSSWLSRRYGQRLILHPRVRDRLENGNPQDVGV
jgi:hypothetical protein